MIKKYLTLYGYVYTYRFTYKYNRFLTSLILLLDSQFGFGSKRHKGKPTNLSQQTNFVDAIPDFNLVLLLSQGISRYNSTTEHKYFLKDLSNFKTSKQCSKLQPCKYFKMDYRNDVNKSRTHIRAALK